MKEPQEIGSELKNARLAMGWTLERAAYETKLRQDIISKIEENQYDLFPSPAYARGFVRIYARKLGLDDGIFLKQLEGTLGEDEIPVGELRPEALESLSEDKNKSGAKISPQMVGLIFIALILLVAFGLGILKLYRIWPALSGSVPEHIEPAQPGTPPASPSAAPAVSSPATTSSPVTGNELPVKKAEAIEKKEEVRRAETITPAPVEPAPMPSTAPPTVPTPAPVSPPVQVHLNSLRFKCDEDSWVRVIGVVAGKEEVLFEGMIEEDKTMPAKNKEPWKAEAFLLTLEDASVVDIIYNDENCGKYEQAEGRASFRMPPQ